MRVSSQPAAAVVPAAVEADQTEAAATPAPAADQAALDAFEKLESKPVNYIGTDWSTTGGGVW